MLKTGKHRDLGVALAKTRYSVRVTECFPDPSAADPKPSTPSLQPCGELYYVATASVSVLAPTLTWGLGVNLVF